MADNRLELEVMESSALERMVQVARIVESCAKFGVSFALDDFGTGYSSLSYLKRLPGANLKIDRTFVSNMQDDSDNLAMVEAILGLASAFGREAIAEGIESVSQGSLLLQLGCEYGQCFEIARPMPAGQFAEWARCWAPPAPWRTHKRIRPESIPLLYTNIGLQTWLRGLESVEEEQRAAAGLFRLHSQRLASWLEGSPAAEVEIEELHNELRDRFEAWSANAHVGCPGERASILSLREVGARLTSAIARKLQDNDP